MKFLFIPILFISSGIFGQALDFDTLSFNGADSIARLYYNHDLNDAEQLAYSLTKDLKSDAEKFRVIFKWICENISYDVAIYHKDNQKEKKLKYQRKKLTKWRLRVSKKTYERVITKKLALCSGYAMLLERMSRSVGLECIIIEGYARNYTDRIGHGKVDHAWNAVKLGSKWYLADITWASGYVDERVTSFTRHFNSSYFLTDPSQFIANHYPRKEQYTFLYERPTLKQFLNSPIKTSAFISSQINHYSPASGKLRVKRDSSIVFSFTTNSDHPPEKASIEVKAPNFLSKENYTLDQNTKGEFLFSHAFKRNGHYLVYIYIKNKLTFVYEISVG